MIQIDMPLPERCEDCPCSYYVQGGRNEGALMCEALEYMGWEEDRAIIRYLKRRPDCPMKEVEG